MDDPMEEDTSRHEVHVSTSFLSAKSSQNHLFWGQSTANSSHPAQIPDEISPEHSPKVTKAQYTALNSSIKPSDIRTSPILRHSQSTGTTGGVSRSPEGMINNKSLSLRFFKLRKDLKLAGYNIDTLIDLEPELYDEIKEESPQPPDLDHYTRASEVRLEGENDAEIIYPQLRWCSYCKAERVTEMEWHPSNKTWYFLPSLASTGICLFGGFLGCFLIPYHMKACKVPVLLCSRCRHILS